MLTLALILFLLSVLVLFIAGLAFVGRLVLYALIVYAIYKLIEYIFS